MARTLLSIADLEKSHDESERSCTTQDLGGHYKHKTYTPILLHYTTSAHSVAGTHPDSKVSKTAHITQTLGRGVPSKLDEFSKLLRIFDMT